jgi:hypothetical protein
MGYENFHDSMGPYPAGGELPRHDEILQRILRVPVGHHYFITYSDRKKVRRIYAAYIKKQIEEHPDSIVLVFPYYDNTNAVRGELTSEGLNTVELEMSGALIIVDITKIVKSQYFQVPEVERLSEFIKQVEDKNKNKTVFVVADMSVFHHLKKSKELLEYEKKLHQDLAEPKNRKELCLYHVRDLKAMFSETEAAELESYHEGKIIAI